MQKISLIVMAALFSAVHNLVWRVDFLVCPEIRHAGRSAVAVQVDFSTHLIITVQPPVNIPAFRLIVRADNDAVCLTHERMV